MGPRTELCVDSQLCRGRDRTFISLFHTLMGPNIFTFVLSWECFGSHRGLEAAAALSDTAVRTKPYQLLN